MKKADYDDPAIVEKWCAERRKQITAYLMRENVAHGEIAEWPAWHVAPYVSIWAIESGLKKDFVGWGVICGDLPTDYVSASELKNPRDALRSIVKRWSELADFMIRDEEHPSIQLGEKSSWPELGPLLKSRVKILDGWLKDDSLWDDAD